MHREGRTGEVEQLLQRASALPDKVYRPLHATFLLETGKGDAAVAEFERLYKSNRKDRDARTWLVFAYFRTGRTTDAEKVLAEALKQNAKDIDALMQRSWLYLAKGRYSE